MADQGRKRPGDDSSDDFGNDTSAKRLRQLVRDNDDVCPIAPNNEVYNRYVFNSRRQHQGETASEFLAVLQRLSQDCNYQHLRDQMVVDAAAARVRDILLQVELLVHPPPLTLERCRELFEAYDREREAEIERRRTAEAEKERKLKAERERKVEEGNERESESGSVAASQKPEGHSGQTAPGGRECCIKGDGDFVQDVQVEKPRANSGDDANKSQSDLDCCSDSEVKKTASGQS